MLLFGVLLSVTFASSLGARILGVVPTASYSHQIVFQPLWKELSLRGHQVTLITTDPIKDKSLTNLTEIDLHFTYELWNKLNMLEISQKGVLSMFIKGLKLSTNMSDMQLQHPEIQKLIKNKNESFDLLIIEVLFPAMFAFAERFKCPLIGLSSLDAPSYIYHFIGNPSHPVLNPAFMLPFSGELTFFQRLISVMFTVFVKAYNDLLSYPAQQSLVKKHFGDDYPLLQDIFQNASLLFVNADPIFHQIRPLLPSVIQIGGGTHIKPAKPLPKQLQEQLDKASQGFIYFSLGSNVKSKELSEQARSIILETFAELPYLVLWKFELENLPGKTDNVIISKWFPQQDILRHPNIKLFITQGGLQSMEEAIYNHIPLVGIPFLGDQPANVVKIVSKGLGLGLDYTTLEKKSFKETILEVINNKKYRNKVIELAQLAKDEPTTGLERAIWWTEYVLRHKGATHLRSPALHLPLYQYFLLDVIGFCLLVVIIIAFLLISVIKLIYKFVYNCFRPTRKIKVQ